MITRIKKNLFNLHLPLSPESAYRKWAPGYDEETDNLMLFYDNLIFKSMLSRISIKGKYILDYGCGTGRYWKYILGSKPAKITGCDISEEMLTRLKVKYSDADIHLIKKNKLNFLADKSVDILISTLVIAHIKNPEKITEEWSRVLKTHADIVITDFHPDLLERGGERTFKYQGRTIKIKNYIYNLSYIENLLGKWGFHKVQVIEQKINEEVKHFYSKLDALNIYNKFYNTSFIYGMHLKR